ncbi:MAG: trypsin-like peptidase domain-containing protein [Fimbriimonadaceae bacterium]|jgi:serine protease Do|nr:trypsin-like peptidase domain-containing protein [Fimbriimonadaceae bacterium]
MSNRKANLVKPPVIILAGVGIIAASLAFSGRGPAPQIKLPFNQPMAAVQQRTVNVPMSAALEQLQIIDQGMSELAEGVSSAVVNIRASASRMSGQGSGFIYRADGWIITNDHVVGDSSTVTVTLADGKEYTGTVYRANDGQIDLAVVKIDANNLPTLPLADSNTVRPGQMAMAVGSPFGLENSVTIGTISATERTGGVMDPRSGVRGYTGMIQTDASINPGNSGGPLVNVLGQVIGVNSTIFSMTGSNSGVGFAIPSNVTKVVADELIQTKKFVRGFLGAELEDLKPFRAKELGVPGGALIGGTRGVAPGTPAANAGLKLGDVIVSAGGREVRNQLDLRIELYRRSPGDELPLTIISGNQRREVSVRLAETPADQRLTTPRTRQGQGDSMEDLFERFGMPDQDRGINPGEPNRPTQPRTPQAPQAGRPRLGVQIQEIDANARRTFSLPENVQGVVVVSVGPESFASRIGLQPGDVVEMINGTAIRNPEQLTSVIGSLNWNDQITVNWARYKDGGVVRNSISRPLAPQ